MYAHALKSTGVEGGLDAPAQNRKSHHPPKSDHRMLPPIACHSWSRSPSRHLPTRRIGWSIESGRFGADMEMSGPSAWDKAPLLGADEEPAFEQAEARKVNESYGSVLAA